jgi:hypothetical protein
MDAGARCNLGLALLAKGEPDHAWTEYTLAVAIAKRSAADDARTELQAAIDDLDALTNVAKASESTAVTAVMSKAARCPPINKPVGDTD